MKQIPLTKGYVALVDDEEFENLNQYRWFAVTNPKHIYAARKLCFMGTHYIQYMHRQILGVSPYQKVKIDHENGDGLFNLRSNLRICDTKKNGMNRKTQTHSSRFKGVSWNTKNKRWVVGIKNDGASTHLGSYTNEIEAAKAYDKAAIRVFGEFARLNFPSEESK